MNKVFYFVAEVSRYSDYSRYHEIESPRVYMLVEDIDPVSAFIKGKFYVESSGWEINTTVFPCVMVERESFIDREFYDPLFNMVENDGLMMLIKG